MRVGAMRRTLAWAILLLLAGPRIGAADLLIRNARLVDGTGAPPRDGVSILVRDKRIAAIGPDLTAAPGVPVLDADGSTVLPGLIDAHVHLGSVPGMDQRHDSPGERAWLISQHLRAYVACGITTVLDAGNGPGDVQAVQDWLAAGNPGPRYLTLGPTLFTPGGFLSPPIPGVSTAEEVEALLDRVVAVHGVGVGVMLEHGWSGLPRLPVHPPTLRDAIVRGAARRGLPIYVEATSEEDQSIALDMGAHALLESFLFRFLEPSDAFVARLKRSGAYQMTTLAITDSQLTAWHLERLDDPLVRLVVPEKELATARDPDTRHAFLRDQAAFRSEE